MERLIPISKMQAQTVNTLKETITSAQERLSLVASVIVQGKDEELQQFGVKGSLFVPGENRPEACSSDMHFLVIEVPEPRPVVDDA